MGRTLGRQEIGALTGGSDLGETCVSSSSDILAMERLPIATGLQEDEARASGAAGWSGQAKEEILFWQRQYRCREECRILLCSHLCGIQSVRLLVITTVTSVEMVVSVCESSNVAVIPTIVEYGKDAKNGHICHQNLMSLERICGWGTEGPGDW